MQLHGRGLPVLAMLITIGVFAYLDITGSVDAANSHTLLWIGFQVFLIAVVPVCILMTTLRLDRREPMKRFVF